MFAFVVISKGGLLLAKRLLASFPDSALYTSQKLQCADYDVIEGDLSAFTKVLFEKHRTLVFIMASGIVVRCIAPYIKHKAHDPAVVVIDETGRFVISLLSGHLGGANEATQQIAQAINAIPVITTASDVHGLLSVDMIAKQHRLIITSLEEAKFVTAAMIEGKHVAISNQTLCPYQSQGTADAAEAIVFIAHHTQHNCAVLHTTLLVPNITIGIGCRRGTSSEHIIGFIRKTLQTLHIDERCVVRLASIDVKSDEAGMLAAAKYFKVPIQFIAANEIRAIEDKFEASDFVRQSVGVGAVCEPSAFIAGGMNGRFLCMKTAENGATISVFESTKIEEELKVMSEK